MAVAVGDKIVAVDLFDNPDDMPKVWRRLLSGFILEAVGPNATGGTGSSTGCGRDVGHPAEFGLGESASRSGMARSTGSSQPTGFRPGAGLRRLASTWQPVDGGVMETEG